MKKLTGMMLGLALVAGTATFTFAADDKAPAKGKAKMVCIDKNKKQTKVGKDGKCADGSDPVAPKGKAKAAPSK